MGQVIHARPSQTDECAVELCLLGTQPQRSRALPLPLLSPVRRSSPSVAHLRHGRYPPHSHSSRQTGASGTLARGRRCPPGVSLCSVTRTAGSRTTFRRTSMRPIWRNTLGVATVAIVAATAAAPTSAFGQGLRCRTPPHRRIVGRPGGERRAQDRHPHHRRQGPGHGAQAPTRRSSRCSRARTARCRPSRPDGSARTSTSTPPMPSDALASGRVDEELFNVTGLVAHGLRRREHRHRAGHRALHHRPQPGAFRTGHAQGRREGADAALDRRHRAQGRQGPGRDFFADVDRPLHRGRGQDREDLARRARPTPASTSRPSR